MAQRIDVQYVQFYTGGNAAPKVTPAKPVREMPLPRVKKHKVHRIYVDPVATLGVIVAVCMLIMMTVGVFRLQKVRQQNEALLKHVQSLQQQNEELQKEYAAGYTLREIQQAALELGMIPKEEATATPIQVQLPQPQEETGNLWHRMGTFIAELFS